MRVNSGLCISTVPIMPPWDRPRRTVLLLLLFSVAFITVALQLGTLNACLALLDKDANSRDPGLNQPHHKRPLPQTHVKSSRRILPK